VVEHSKSDRQRIAGTLRHHGYHIAEMGLNLLCIHQSDRTIEGFGGVAVSAYRSHAGEQPAGSIWQTMKSGGGRQ
jgi:hypothetical protein